MDPKRKKRGSRIAQERRSHPGKYQDTALIELFQPAQPGSPDSLRPMHTVQSAFGPVAGGSARIGGEVGTSGNQVVAIAGAGVPHLAPRAAAVRIRNATSGTQEHQVQASVMPHLAVGWAWAGLARALQMWPQRSSGHNGPGRAERMP